jgi:hypothetical protein
MEPKVAENWGVQAFKGTLYETQTQIMNLLSSLKDPESAKILTDSFENEPYSFVFFNTARAIQQGLPATPENVKAEAKRQQRDRTPTQMGLELTSKNICANSPVPDGWIKTDEGWDSTRCGNPTTITDNVWTITQYAGLPVGSSLDACADAPVPDGWAQTSVGWNSTKCGNPTTIVNNVQTIRRVK